MKKTLVTLIGLAAFSLTGGYAAAFTPGNIIVGRLGDGNTTLSGNATSISLLEFSPSGGAAYQTLSTQFAGENLQTDSGSATSNTLRYLAITPPLERQASPLQTTRLHKSLMSQPETWFHESLSPPEVPR